MLDALLFYLIFAIVKLISFGKRLVMLYVFLKSLLALG
jgi:hypothetical protein